MLPHRNVATMCSIVPLSQVLFRGPPCFPVREGCEDCVGNYLCEMILPIKNPRIWKVWLQNRTLPKRDDLRSLKKGCKFPFRNLQGIPTSTITGSPAPAAGYPEAPTVPNVARTRRRHLATKLSLVGQTTSHCATGPRYLDQIRSSQW